MYYKAINKSTKLIEGWGYTKSLEMEAKRWNLNDVELLEIPEEECKRINDDEDKEDQLAKASWKDDEAFFKKMDRDKHCYLKYEIGTGKDFPIYNVDDYVYCQAITKDEYENLKKELDEHLKRLEDFDRANSIRYDFDNY